VTLAQKIEIGIAIAGAVGLGAVIQLVVSHFLRRRERKADLADKSVQMSGKSVEIAESVMVRMESDMTRMRAELTTQTEALAKAQQQLLELQTGPRRTDDEVDLELTTVRNKLHDAQVDMGGVASNLSAGLLVLRQGLVSVFPDLPPRVGDPPPMDEDEYQAMIDQRRDEDWRRYEESGG
jgi:hypothetical protein